MSERYVILEHDWNGVHWDVMFADGASLRTWAVDSPIEAGTTLPARPLPPHRLVYLDFEGPVSGDRGEVRAWDRGSYRALAWTEDRVDVVVAGTQLKGRLILSRDGAGDWSFLFAPGNVD